MAFGFDKLVGLVCLMSLPQVVAADGPYIAAATLISNPQTAAGSSLGQSNLVGTVTFTQNVGENKVLIAGRLQLGSDFTGQNFTIGFHVHSTSNFTGGCASAGLHYNPEGKVHGGPFDSNRHVGDLGNINFTNANPRVSEFTFFDTVITLVGRQTIVGRSLVVHYGTDDLGRGGNDESSKTGNAGLRYACGPIALVSDFSPSSAMSNFANGSLFMSVLALLLTMYGRQ